VKEDPETGQTIISGMGELHLEVLVDRMQREYNVQANVGKPQVVYRETIQRQARGEGRFEREIQGVQHRAHVIVQVQPLSRGQGNQISMEAPETQIPPSFHAAVEQGIREALEAGVSKGYPMVDVRVTVEGGSFYEGMASELAYKVAANLAFQSACEQAEPTLLEPMMRLNVLVPSEFMGDVLGDLHARGGKVEGIEQRGVIQSINALVPLRGTFGYSTALRSLTQGRGTFTMQFSHYDRVSASS